jgi:hypothetical protein
MRQTILIAQPADVMVFHLAICRQCDGPDHVLPIPFEDPIEREKWAMAHTEGTSHFSVNFSTEIRINVT